jgi:hypothetical protein
MAHGQDAWDGKGNGVRDVPMGPLGGVCILHIGKPDFEVRSLDEGGAAYRGGLRVGDLITVANGKPFLPYDNDPASGGRGGPEGLGRAIEESEAGRKSLKLVVMRGGKRKELTIPIKPAAGLSRNWPLDKCSKLQKYQAGICAYLTDKQRGSGHWRTGYGTGADWVTTGLSALALLGSGEKRYADNVRSSASFFAGQDPASQGSNWALYYAGVFMCEYYLCTEDKKAKPFIEKAVRAFETRINPANGSFGHGSDPVASGYNGSGINIVGSGIVWFWGLASKCGVKVDKAVWEKAVNHLEYSTGKNGGVAYTRISSRGNANHNSHGRTAHVLMGLSLMGQGKNHVQRLAGYLQNNPGNVREAHAYSCPAVMATFLALFMVDRDAYRELLDKWAWYFTLSRGPDSRALYIGSKRNSGGDTYLNRDLIMNASVGVILAAHQQRLFMYGGMPSIPGVAPAELPPSLRRLYVNLDNGRYGETIRRLQTHVSSASRGPGADSAKAMLDHLVQSKVMPAWQDVKDPLEKGDWYKVYEAFKTFHKTYGAVDALGAEIREVGEKLQDENIRTLVERGKLYYALVDAWQNQPARRERVVAEFEKLAKVEDLYGLRAGKTAEVVRQKAEEKGVPLGEL